MSAKTKVHAAPPHHLSRLRGACSVGRNPPKRLCPLWGATCAARDRPAPSDVLPQLPERRVRPPSPWAARGPATHPASGPSALGRAAGGQ
jgi:hypothetical protein